MARSLRVALCRDDLLRGGDGGLKVGEVVRVGGLPGGGEIALLAQVVVDVVEELVLPMIERVPLLIVVTLPIGTIVVVAEGAVRLYRAKVIDDDDIEVDSAAVVTAVLRLRTRIRVRVGEIGKYSISVSSVDRFWGIFFCEFSSPL